MRKAFCIILAGLSLVQPGCIFLAGDHVRTSEEVGRHHWLLFALLGVFLTLFIASSIVILVKGVSEKETPQTTAAAILMAISVVIVLLLTG